MTEIIALARKALHRAAGALAGACVALILTSAAHEVKAAGERMERRIEVDGMRRSYTLFLPENPGSRRQWPLIVAFHPALAQGIWMERYAAFQNEAAGGNFAIAYPDGFRRGWNAGDCCGAAYRNKVDDVAFYRAIVADVGRLVPLEGKTYLTGFSNGARMVYHLMCVAPKTIAAAATLGATRDMERCSGSRIPLLHIHGAEDEASPALGGTLPGRIGAAIGYISPATEVTKDVARRNGCRSKPTTVSRRNTLGTDCTFYCPGTDAEVGLCIIPDAGHVWPGMPSGMKMFGPYRPELDASREILSFFERH